MCTFALAPVTIAVDGLYSVTYSDRWAAKWESTRHSVHYIMARPNFVTFVVCAHKEKEITFRIDMHSKSATCCLFGGFFYPSMHVQSLTFVCELILEMHFKSARWVGGWMNCLKPIWWWWWCWWYKDDSGFNVRGVFSSPAEKNNNKVTNFVHALLSNNNFSLSPAPEISLRIAKVDTY